MKSLKIIFIMSILLGCIFFLSRVTGADTLFDSFEEGNDWEMVTWGDEAKLNISKNEISEGRYSLKVSFTPQGRKEKNKGIFIRKSISGTPEELKKIVVDIYNDTGTENISLAIALDSEEYYESPQTVLKKGWNKNLLFDLLQNNFKSGSSGWEYSTSLKKNLGLGAFFFIFYLNNTKYGEIYVDNIRTGAPAVKKSVKKKTPFIKKKTAPGQYIAPEIRSVKGHKGTVSQYGLLELDVDFSGTYFDPFDSSDIQLSGVFVSPDRRILNVDGFLYSAKFDSEKIQDPVWKIRFTPDKSGTWKYFVKVRNPKGKVRSSMYQFTCSPSSRDGFIRVDKGHPEFFSTDRGTFYYPIGQNVGWASQTEYDQYFTEMAANGENWGRLWMANWNVALEWKPMGYYRGLGSYNLNNALRLDEIMQAAEKKSVYLQLVFDFHGAFSTTVNPEWQNNPYNAENGGPCSDPQEFFTSESAKSLYKKRLRYIIARWGYSTHVLAWEFFNEINFTDGFNRSIDKEWHEEMSRFVKRIDPYKHLNTTSYYNEFNEKTYELDTIDFAQIHNYYSEIVQMMKNIPARMKQFNKPYFFGEFGSDSRDGVDDLDKKGVFNHAGIWAQFMMPSGGNAMPWWWNTHIHPNKLYYHFKALAAFSSGIDRREFKFTSIKEKLSAGDITLELLGLQDKNFIMFWVCDRKGMKYKDREAPLNIMNVKVTIKDMEKGNYSVEFWDTYTGKVMKKISLNVNGKILDLKLPDFKNDMACKIKKVK
ncbi:MAG: DUF5060 domain-containing protein [Spirochaetes bacterium]|nr:DUF5060 domain-containing protein [Spirochaetota bacterium]